MAFEFTLPSLGEGIDGGDVIDVLVSAGDTVEQGQTLLELETSKAAIPVPAPMSGRVSGVHVKQGDHVTVGQKLVTLDDGAARETSRPQRETAQPRAAGEGRSEVVTRQAAPETVPARAPEPQPRPQEPASDLPVAAAPATRRLARELGVALRQVQGTGPGGRVSEDDVKAHARRLIAGASVPAAGAPHMPRGVALPDFTKWGDVRREPISSMRRTIAQRLSYAWNTIPQVTHFDESDITELDRERRRFAPSVESGGAKLTVTAIAVKAAAIALRAMPQFNSSLDFEAGELVLKQYVHIGVAVDTERGLVVPVIRDADRKSVRELATELTELAERTRQRQVTLDELQGGGFTVTNLGGIGGTGFSPIVNWPEVAILGLARSQRRTTGDAEAGERTILPLCLSYDHRVIDGASAARFVRLIAELLEDPFRMVLES